MAAAQNEKQLESAADVGRHLGSLLEVSSPAASGPLRAPLRPAAGRTLQVRQGKRCTKAPRFLHQPHRNPPPCCKLTYNKREPLLLRQSASSYCILAYRSYIIRISSSLPYQLIGGLTFRLPFLNRSINSSYALTFLHLPKTPRTAPLLNMALLEVQE